MKAIGKWSINGIFGEHRMNWRASLFPTFQIENRSKIIEFQYAVIQKSEEEEEEVLECRLLQLIEWSVGVRKQLQVTSYTSSCWVDSYIAFLYSLNSLALHLKASFWSKTVHFLWDPRVWLSANNINGSDQAASSSVWSHLCHKFFLVPTNVYPIFNILINS